MCCTAAFPTDVQDKKLIGLSVLIERLQRFLHRQFSLPGSYRVHSYNLPVNDVNAADDLEHFHQGTMGHVLIPVLTPNISHTGGTIRSLKW